MQAEHTPVNRPPQAQQWLKRIDRHGVDLVLLDPQMDAAVVRTLDADPAWVPTCHEPELFIYARVACG